MQYIQHRMARQSELPFWSNSQFPETIGLPGDIVKATVMVNRVVCIHSSHGYMGVEYLIIMSSDDGYPLRWHTKTPPAALAQGEGNLFEIIFKIKGYGRIHGKMQTLVTNVKLAHPNSNVVFS